MHHVFVETNWVVDYAAPAHHKKLPAVELLGRADRGEIQLYLPAICLNEARRTLQKFQPRHEADAIRNFVLWATRERKISSQDGDVVRRTLDLFENKVRGELGQIDATLASLREQRGLDVFALDEAMLVRAIDLSGGVLDAIQPFDQAILAAILVRAEGLRAAGEAKLSFCELDGDLQPWDRKSNPKPLLKKLYDDAGIWVFGTFDLDEPPRPPGWGGTDSG